MVATLRVRRPSGWTRGRRDGLRAGHRRRRVAGPPRRAVPRRARDRRRGWSRYCEDARPRAVGPVDDDAAGRRSTSGSPPTSGRCCRCAGALASRSAHGGTAPARVARAARRPLGRRARDGHAAWATGLSGLTACGSPVRSSTCPVLDGGPRPARALGRDAPSADGPVAVRLTEVEAYAGERRPRLARLPRPHAPQRGHVRPARAGSTSTSPTACTGA